MAECESNYSIQGKDLVGFDEVSDTASSANADTPDAAASEKANDAPSTDRPQIIKRQQDSQFETSKKIRTFLDQGKEKSINKFSQSARVLQRRSSPPLSSDSQLLSCSNRQKGKRSIFGSSGFMHMTGKSYSGSKSSSFLSRLNAALEDESADTENTESPITLNRSRTFTTGTTELYFQSTLDTKSPFQTTNPGPRPFASSKSTRIPHLAKHSTQKQDHLKQTILDPSFDHQKRTLSFKLSSESLTLNTQVITSSKSDDKVDYSPSEFTNCNADKSESSDGSSMVSFTEAMSTLSPPSAKVPSLLHGISNQKKHSSSDSATTSLSLPFPNTGFMSSWDCEEDEVSKLKVRSPCSLLSSTSDSVLSERRTPTKSLNRPSILRRHQTMITKRSEFMKTLERGGQSRAMGLYNALNRKSLVFAPENYVPDPSREDCRILPCTKFISKPDDTTKRIAPQTVVDVLDGKYKDEYDLLYIIDCRFPYEFEGGHIKTAVNVNTTNELEKLLLQPAITEKRVLIIFHCEFSCERGPRMARHLRNQDREANASHYPAVFYPEVYVMEGGYSGFFKENRKYCWPEAYVEMRDEKHSKEFEEHMRTFGREFSRSASKGFLGTESRKSRSENDPFQSPFISKNKSTSSTSTNTLTTSKTNTNNTAGSVNGSNSSSTTGSANTPVSNNAANSASTGNVNGSKSSTNSVESTSTKKNTNVSSSKNHSTESKHSTHETLNASSKTTFSSVVNSVKTAALLGSPLSPLSFSTTPKTFVPSQQILSRISALQRPIARPRSTRPLAERVLKDLSKPAAACTSTVSDATATNKKIPGNPASTYSPSLNPSTALDNFFSGFRQTKPVFRGISP